MDLEILNIATNTDNNRNIKNHTHYSKLKNSLCGDEVKIKLIIKNDKIIRARAHPSLRSPLTPGSNHGAPQGRITANPGPAHQPRTSIEMGGPWGPRAHPNLARPLFFFFWMRLNMISLIL